MQNVGAAALFLPVVSRISARTGLPLSRLLMPMGFCAILGGTVTMVGSSPLILLNDLILTSNQALPPAQKMEHLRPVRRDAGRAGPGRYRHPVFRAGRPLRAAGYQIPEQHRRLQHHEYFQDIYGIDYALFEVEVPARQPAGGHDARRRRERLGYSGHCDACARTRILRIGPGALARDLGIEAGMVLAILAAPHDVDSALSQQYGLKKFAGTWRSSVKCWPSTSSGVAEVVIPPGSSLIGKSARDVWMRKTYGLAMVALHRGGKTLREGDDIRNLPLQAGDTLVVHTSWDALARLESEPRLRRGHHRISRVRRCARKKSAMPWLFFWSPSAWCCLRTCACRYRC